MRGDEEGGRGVTASPAARTRGWRSPRGRGGVVLATVGLPARRRRLDLTVGVGMINASWLDGCSAPSASSRGGRGFSIAGRLLHSWSPGLAAFAGRVCSRLLFRAWRHIRCGRWRSRRDRGAGWLGPGRERGGGEDVGSGRRLSHVHHEYSFLFHPVNALLTLLLGAPPAAWQKAMGVAGEARLWLPDHVIMAMLVSLVVAAVLILVRRWLSVDRPSTLQQMLELLLSGLRDLIDDVVGHGHGKPFVPFIAGLAFFIFLSQHLRAVLLPPAADGEHEHDLRAVDHRVPVLQHRRARDIGPFKLRDALRGPGVVAVPADDSDRDHLAPGARPVAGAAVVRQHLRRAHRDRHLLRPRSRSSSRGR